jgi:hypothetical protein
MAFEDLTICHRKLQPTRGPCCRPVNHQRRGVGGLTGLRSHLAGNCACIGHLGPNVLAGIPPRQRDPRYRAVASLRGGLSRRTLNPGGVLKHHEGAKRTQKYANPGEFAGAVTEERSPRSLNRRERTQRYANLVDFADYVAKERSLSDSESARTKATRSRANEADSPADLVDGWRLLGTDDKASPRAWLLHSGVRFRDHVHPLWGAEGRWSRRRSRRGLRPIRPATRHPRPEGQKPVVRES